jgi:hypothetical protein
MNRFLVIGGVGGLAWAAALRGWMAQLANGMPDSQSQVTWLTHVLILLPGVAVGVLLGYSAYLRASGQHGSRWLIFTPVLFASALVDPKIFIGLITEGIGGGSLIVIATALSVGYVLTRARWSTKRALVALLGAFGLLVMFGMGEMAAPAGTPRGVWVGLFRAGARPALGIARCCRIGRFARHLESPLVDRPRSAHRVCLGGRTARLHGPGCDRGRIERHVVGNLLWILAPAWSRWLARLGGLPLAARRTAPRALARSVALPLRRRCSPLRSSHSTSKASSRRRSAGARSAYPAAALAGAYALVGRRRWLRALASLLPLSAIPSGP